MTQTSLAKMVPFNTGNANLSALRVNGEAQFLSLIAQVLKEEKGYITGAAERLKVCRQTLTRWIAAYPVLQAARDRARE